MPIKLLNILISNGYDNNLPYLHPYFSRFQVNPHAMPESLTTKGRVAFSSLRDYRESAVFIERIMHLLILSKLPKVYRLIRTERNGKYFSIVRQNLCLVGELVRSD